MLVSCGVADCISAGVCARHLQQNQGDIKRTKTDIIFDINNDNWKFNRILCRPCHGAGAGISTQNRPNNANVTPSNGTGHLPLIPLVVLANVISCLNPLELFKFVFLNSKIESYLIIEMDIRKW